MYPRSHRLAFPLLVVVLAAGVAVTAVRPAVAGDAAPPKLPLTFDEAKAQGKQVDWGPQCDTSRGKVAVPTGYAPPCVEPWTAGTDNGGGTAPGVTADTITIALYQAQPDLLQQSFFEASGSDESLAAERETTQQYVDFFSAHYEMYGRTVKLVPVKASGPPDDDVAAKADAIKVATEVHAFASFGGPGETPAYAEELAARGVLCVGDCVIAQPQSFLEAHAPYVWPTTASPEQAGLHWAAFVGRQLGTKPARYAGDPSLAKKRVYGVVHYDDDAGNFSRSVTSFEKQLAKYGVKPAVTIPYSLDLTTAQQDARTLIAKLQSSGVTSVVLAGDPVFPSILTKEATAQGYFPEWVVLGYAFTDTSVFGRTYDQQQWAHAFGVSLLPARTADDVDELANVITWQTGEPPAAKTFRELVQAPLVFFTGVHLAGPHLTAKTFAAGLARYPADAATVPTRLHLSWGKHGIWPGRDLTGGDDATVIWWDAKSSGPDEVGRDGKGIWRYADDGKRYLPKDWPRAPIKLFDVATSTGVITQLTPAETPPTYPSPAG